MPRLDFLRAALADHIHPGGGDVHIIPVSIPAPDHIDLPPAVDPETNHDPEVVVGAPDPSPLLVADDPHPVDEVPTPPAPPIAHVDVTGYHGRFGSLHVDMHGWADLLVV